MSVVLNFPRLGERYIVKRVDDNAVAALHTPCFQAGDELAHKSSRLIIRDRPRGVVHVDVHLPSISWRLCTMEQSSVPAHRDRRADRRRDRRGYQTKARGRAGEVQKSLGRIEEMQVEGVKR